MDTTGDNSFLRDRISNVHLDLTFRLVIHNSTYHMERHSKGSKFGTEKLIVNDIENLVKVQEAHVVIFTLRPRADWLSSLYSEDLQTMRIYLVNHAECH